MKIIRKLFEFFRNKIDETNSIPHPEIRKRNERIPNHDIIRSLILNNYSTGKVIKHLKMSRCGSSYKRINNIKNTLLIKKHTQINIVSKPRKASKLSNDRKK